MVVMLNLSPNWLLLVASSIFTSATTTPPVPDHSPVDNANMTNSIVEPKTYTCHKFYAEVVITYGYPSQPFGRFSQSFLRSALKHGFNEVRATQPHHTPAREARVPDGQWSYSYAPEPYGRRGGAQLRFEMRESERKPESVLGLTYQDLAEAILCLQEYADKTGGRVWVEGAGLELYHEEDLVQIVAEGTVRNIKAEGEGDVIVAR